MKRAAAFASGLLLLAGLAAVLRPAPASRELQAPPQETQKPNYDYMNTFRSRSTRPLGLTEDPAMKRMLDQGAVRWAVRAGARQVMD